MKDRGFMSRQKKRQIKKRRYKMSKRGENIYKRKDGRWEARYPKAYSDNGHVIYGSVYAGSYSEVKAKKIKAQSKLDSAVQASYRQETEELTLNEMAEKWLCQKSEFVKESTYVRYRYLYEKHIGADYGAEKLKKLDYTEIELSIRSKQKENAAVKLSAKTIQDVLSVYRLLISFGLQNGYIKENAAAALNKKAAALTKNVTETNLFLPKELAKLENYALSMRTARHFGIILAMYTGVRIGELCALRWQDIDLENGILYIRNTIQRLKDFSGRSEKQTKLVIGSPKTSSSLRVIPLSTFLIEKLIEYKSAPHFFFLTGKETPEEPRSYLYFYKKQLRNCSLREYTFHTIRHSFATRCIERGIDIKSLSEILGHSGVKITLNRYVHPSLETKRQQLEKLSGIYKPS